MRELEGNCLRGWPGGHLRKRFPRLLLGRSHSLKADPCYQPHHLTSGQRLKCPPRGGWFPRECQDAVAFSDHHWPRLLGAQAPLRQWEKFSLCRVINLLCRRTPSLLLFEALIVRFYPQSAVSEEQTAKAPFKMKETRIKEGRFKLPQGARASGRLRPSARYVNLDPTRCRRVLDHVPPSCR